MTSFLRYFGAFRRFIILQNIAAGKLFKLICCLQMVLCIITVFLQGITSRFDAYQLFQNCDNSDGFRIKDYKRDYAFYRGLPRRRALILMPMLEAKRRKCQETQQRNAACCTAQTRGEECWTRRAGADKTRHILFATFWKADDLTRRARPKTSKWKRFHSIGKKIISAKRCALPASLA
ncbi:MAG: hypothetical protein K0S28_293 [Paucimonas sp.]|jgi:hypothetical protein|nr:hypothetical protein [Paucimonas sp.]